MVELWSEAHPGKAIPLVFSYISTRVHEIQWDDSRNASAQQVLQRKIASQLESWQKDEKQFVKST